MGFVCHCAELRNLYTKSLIFQKGNPAGPDGFIVTKTGGDRKKEQAAVKRSDSDNYRERSPKELHGGSSPVLPVQT
jgi:hypothetical protein